MEEREYSVLEISSDTVSVVFFPPNSMMCIGVNEIHEKLVLREGMVTPTRSEPKVMMLNPNGHAVVIQKDETVAEFHPIAPEMVKMHEKQKNMKYVWPR